MPPSPRPASQDYHSKPQFDDRHKAEKTAMQRQGFHGIRLQDAPKELTDALVADVVRLELERASQEPLLEQPSRPNGKQTLQPGREQEAGNQSKQEQRPGK